MAPPKGRTPRSGEVAGAVHLAQALAPTARLAGSDMVVERATPSRGDDHG